MKTRPKLTFASFFDLWRQTFTAFGEDRVGRHAAALAYYTVFSLSPLLIVSISIAALVFTDQAKVVGAIQSQIQDTVGPTAAKAIEQMIQSSNGHGGNTGKPITATIIATLIALWGASGLFGALQDSLNGIWGVMARSDLGITGLIRARFVSFAMVLGVGFLLLVSLVLSTVFAAISKAASGTLGDSVAIGWVLNFSLGLIVSTLLFAAIYQILPDVDVRWKDVWIGAFVTGLLFSMGRLGLGWYLARPGTESPYGSAGALVVLLLWVNYASTILFIGAEFTKAYANTFGSKLKPSEYGVALLPADRAAQGMTPHPTLAVTKGAPQKNSKTGIAAVTKTEVTPEKRAEMEKARRQDFEHTLSVVAGGFLVIAWFLRKKRNEV